MQDLTTGALTVGRTGNEVLAAVRAAAAAEGIDADVYSHPLGRARPRGGPGDRPVGRSRAASPGPGDYPVHPDTAYALELAVRVRCPSGTGSACGWPSRRASPLTADGMQYLGGRQTELILI